VKLKGWNGLLLGIGVGLVVAHLYHTKTAGPGTVTSKARSSAGG
jgi:hypothetical protein